MDKPDSQTRSSHSPPGLLEALRTDFPASIVVFLVALPLCMGIAIASGAPVASGLITGIVGGLIVGMLSGQPLQVSGPAAGLTVVVYGLIQDHGLAILGAAVLIGGAIQFAAGMCGLGQWFRAVSPAVIRGMLSGIGVLIFASQIHVMVDAKPKDDGVQNLVAIPAALYDGLPLPEWETHSAREFRTARLKQIDQLHGTQENIYKNLNRALSKDSMPETVLSVAAERQAAVTQQLGAIRGDLNRLDATTLDDPQDAARLQASVEEAFQTSQRAQAVLEQGKLEAIQETQGAVLLALKNPLEQLTSHEWATKLGLLTILIIVLWQTMAPRKLRIIPGPLVATVLVTAAAAIVSLPVLHVDVPDNLLRGVNVLSLEALRENFSIGVLLKAGIVVAVIASAETLLCATAVDQMHQGQRTRYNKELWSQGVGNMICGLLGALPMTGVIVRSSVNVHAGARTRLSAILHGLWLLIFVAALAFVLRMIPTACLAGILVYTGWKLINARNNLVELARYGKGEVVIYLVTLTVIVVEDLLTGVLVGVALAGVKLLYTFSHLRTTLEIDHEQRKATLFLEGTATFLRLPRLAAELERVPSNVELHVDFHRLRYIDHACLELFINWAKQHESMGGKLVLDWESLNARFSSENQFGLQRRLQGPQSSGSRAA
ncbi:MAG: SulP family inorganic anion transporter [Nitrococcus mobilis]|nr:SulP family inorganic anion transporter [Nitrococcus mobilis]